MTSVQAVAGLIIQTLVDHANLDDTERARALEAASSRRVVSSTGRGGGLTLGGAWMGAELRVDIQRQASNTGTAPHSPSHPRSRQPTTHRYPRRQPHAGARLRRHRPMVPESGWHHGPPRPCPHLLRYRPTRVAPTPHRHRHSRPQRLSEQHRPPNTFVYYRESYQHPPNCPQQEHSAK